MNSATAQEQGLLTKLKLFFCCFIGGVSSQAQGLEVSPLVHEMHSSGPLSSSRIAVRNPSDNPLPLDMQVQRIQFKPDGSYDLSVQEEDLLVFPPAVLLGPGARQTVRLQWVGPTQLERSRSYFISLSQPALTQPREPQNGVKLMLTFNILVHISSRDLQPQLQVRSVKPIKHGALTLLQASVFNAGQRYGYISDNTLRLSVGNKLLSVLQPGELRQRGKDVFLPPGGQRTVLIPLDREGEVWSAPIRLELLPANYL